MSTDNRPKITTSQVIALLDEGKDREQIREHFGLSAGDLKKLFQNSALKGKKTRKAPGFIFEDDTVAKEEEVAETANVSDTLEEDRSEEQIAEEAQQDADREDLEAHEAEENTWAN